MNLFEKYIYYTKEELNFLNLGGTIQSTDTGIEIIIKLFNVKSRMIPVQKYVIKESQEVIKTISTLGDTYKEAFQEVKSAFSNGVNLTPYLSKDTKTPTKYDRLLIDWKMHHLHLTKKESSNEDLVERSDYLLLFIIENNIVYFIDIEKHGETNVFAKQQYLEIVNNNWSYLFESHRIPRQVYNDSKLSNSNIRQLRKKGINTPFFVGDKSYLGLGDGISGAGTNFSHQNEAMRIKRYLTTMEEYCKLYEKNI